MTGAHGIDLTTLEREGDTGPFTVKIGTGSYQMVDPRGLTYDELVALMTDANEGKVLDALSKMVPAEEQAAFLTEARKTPIFKLEALSRAYLEHYGLTLPEVSASPPS